MQAQTSSVSSTTNGLKRDASQLSDEEETDGNRKQPTSASFTRDSDSDDSDSCSSVSGDDTPAPAWHRLDDLRALAIGASSFSTMRAYSSALVHAATEASPELADASHALALPALKQGSWADQALMFCLRVSASVFRSCRSRVDVVRLSLSQIVHADFLSISPVRAFSPGLARRRVWRPAFGTVGRRSSVGGRRR